MSPMQFILVMDVLNSLIEKASNEGLLQPLSTRSIHNHVSLYANDVVLFLHPVATDLHLVDDVLQLCGAQLLGSKPTFRKEVSHLFSAQSRIWW